MSLFSTGLRVAPLLLTLLLLALAAFFGWHFREPVDAGLMAAAILFVAWRLRVWQGFRS